MRCEWPETTSPARRMAGERSTLTCVSDIAMPYLLQARPAWRGKLHAIAFFSAIPAGVALIAIADGAAATVGASIYAATLLLLFGTSAAYHRLAQSEYARKIMQRRQARHFRARHPCLRPDFSVAGVSTADTRFTQSPVRKNDRTVESAVAHQQIAPQPDEPHRFVIGQLAQKKRHIVKIRRRIALAYFAAGAPADMPGHGLIAAKLTPQSRPRHPFQFAHVHVSFALVRVTFGLTRDPCSNCRQQHR